MMIPVSIKEFAEKTIRANPNEYKKAELMASLKEALAAKQNGAKCPICGSPIWAAGSAVSGSYMCFSCMTGEADDSEDYEITE